MKLDQLRAFVAVATSLNMTRASELLHLTQPAVSAAIAALEGRYRTRLFSRVGRGLELTEAGRAFFPEAKAVLQRADEARRVLDDLAGMQIGELRLAASQTVANYWLPKRMARFAADYPGISIMLSASNTLQTVAALTRGEADIGFIEGEFDNPCIESHIIGGDHLGLYVAPDHPLTRAAANIKSLTQAQWLLREPGSGTREHFIACLPSLGLDIRSIDVRLELPSNGAALEAVQLGGLVTVVSDLAAHSRWKAGLVARLDYELPPRSFKLITYKERYLGHAAQAFLHRLRECKTDLPRYFLLREKTVSVGHRDSRQ